MPRVPQYQPQVAPRTEIALPRDRFNLPSGAFKSGNWRLIERAGEDLQKLGGVLEQRHQKLETDNNILTASEKYQALNKELRALEWGVDGEGGYYSLKGADAKENVKNLDADFIELREKYSGQLENDEQKKIFNLKVDNLQDNSLDRMARHTAGQNEVRKRQVLDAQLKLDTEETLSLYNNPGMFYPALERTDDSLRMRLSLEGVDKKAVDAAVKTQRSNLLGNSIIRLSKESNDLATAWYNKVKKDKELLTGDKDKVENALKTSNLLARSQAQTDRILLKYTEDEESKALAEARSIKNPEERKMTVKKVEARYAQDRRIEAETQSKITDKLTEGIFKSTSYDEAIRYASEGPTGESKKALEEYANGKFKDKKQPSNPVLLQQAKIRIDKTVSNTATEKEKIRSLEQLRLEYENKISKEEFTQLVNYRNNDGNIQFITTKKLKSRYERYSGKDPKKKHNQAQYAAFVKNVTAQLKPGEVPTDSDLDKYSSQFFVEGVVKDGILYDIFGYGGITYGEAKQKGITKGWLPTLTDDQIEEVTLAAKKNNAVLRAQGKPEIALNSRNLRRLYKVNFMGLSHNEEDEL